MNKELNELASERQRRYGLKAREDFDVKMPQGGVLRLFSALRNAPPRSFSGHVTRYFYDFKNGFSLDLEKKYAQPLDKQGVDMLSLILTDRTEIHLAPLGSSMGVSVCLLQKDQSTCFCLGSCKDALMELIRQYSEV